MFFLDILYWADTSDKTIKRSFIPDPAYPDSSSGYAQNLELKGLTKPSALAIDWVSEYVSIWLNLGLSFVNIFYKTFKN